MTDTPTYTAWQFNGIYRYALALECTRGYLLTRFRPVAIREYPEDGEEVWRLPSGSKITISPYEPCDREV